MNDHRLFICNDEGVNDCFLGHYGILVAHLNEISRREDDRETVLDDTPVVNAPGDSFLIRDSLNPLQLVHRAKVRV